VLSPRARPGAPVSMPLTWAQVKNGLDPARFTLRSAPALLKQTRPWEGYEEAACSVVDVAMRVAGSKGQPEIEGKSMEGKSQRKKKSRSARRGGSGKPAR